MANVDAGSDLTVAFAAADTDALVTHARAKPGPVVRFLTGRLCSADEETKLRAVRVLVPCSASLGC